MNQLATTNFKLRGKHQTSEQDTKIFQAFQKHLEKGEYYKLYDATSNLPRITSRLDLSNPLPLCWLEGFFNDWAIETGRSPSKKPSASYLSSPLLSVVGSKFLPNGPLLIQAKNSCHKYINKYEKYQPTHDKADVSPIFLAYMKRLVPDEDEHHLFMQWLAHIFQMPQERPSWHVMLSSEPGVGKGFLVESILHPLLTHTSVVSSFTKVLSQFSTIIEENLVCLLDDCKAKTEDTQTKLKSLLSEARAYCEHKGKQGGMVNTYTRFILASNEDKPLFLDETERRWWVPAPLKHMENLEETQAFIKTLDKWIDLPGSLCAVYNYFMQYDLSTFNYKYVAQSETLKAIIGLSKNVHAQFLADYILDNKVFTFTELMTAFDTVKLQRPTPAHFAHLLSEAKYVNKRPRIEGKETSLCHPKDIALEGIRSAYAARMAF